mmetsp:Transcript_14478/g.29773  ORF Transcript_14478/g.29773 Transcript_14478/m.29773 type:complete len:80 (-) Transcript_14478:19-258(-)
MSEAWEPVQNEDDHVIMEVEIPYSRQLGLFWMGPSPTAILGAVENMFGMRKKYSHQRHSSGQGFRSKSTCCFQEAIPVF